MTSPETGLPSQETLDYWRWRGVVQRIQGYLIPGPIRPQGYIEQSYKETTGGAHRKRYKTGFIGPDYEFYIFAYRTVLKMENPDQDEILGGNTHEVEIRLAATESRPAASLIVQLDETNRASISHPESPGQRVFLKDYRFLHDISEKLEPFQQFLPECGMGNAENETHFLIDQLLPPLKIVDNL